MYRSAKHLMGYQLGAEDGEIGRVKDFYLEDTSWFVRYLVADTNHWLPGQLVLISPYAIRGFDDSKKVVNVAMTKAKIQASPRAEEHQPISRQFETLYHTYYNWPYYWQGVGFWGPGPATPAVPPEALPTPEKLEAQALPEDRHLQSLGEMKGYPLHAPDREIGTVSDALVEDAEMRLSYLVVDTGHWWPGKKVLLSTAWVEKVDWTEPSVHVEIASEAIRSAPEYKDGMDLDRDYEERLHAHYGLGHWKARMAA